MRSKKLLLVIIGILVIVAVAAAAYHYFGGAGLGVPVPGPINQLPAKPPAKIDAIAMVRLQDGKIFYFIDGTFVTPLTYQGSNLIGDFTIRGDAAKNRIPVIIPTIGKDQVTFGSVGSGSSSAEEFGLVSTAEVQKNVQPQMPVQLRIQINPDKDSLLVEQLNGLIQGDPAAFKSILLAPVMVAVVK